MILMFLIDTSVWIRHFAKADPFDLRDICSVNERIMCLPVYQEILQGISDHKTFQVIRDSLDAAPFVEDPLERRVFQEAANLYRMARRQGLTIRSSVDCIIAACAIGNNLTVLHRDRDFPALAKISVLKERGVS